MNWPWQKTLFRALVIWVVTSLSVILLSRWLDNFQVDSWRSALAMAGVFGIINAFIWPALVRIALPLTVLTLGLGVLILNGLIVTIASHINLDTIHLSGYSTAVVVALGITLINGLLLSALSVDDDDFYYLNVVRRRLRKASKITPSNKPGLFFLEIDGLAHDVLESAIKRGQTPNMARWLNQGDYRLKKWETDWSSQTSAMQAGILHGNNDDMPAFRWWEKDRNAAIVSNHPKDAMEIESRHSDGSGLLADNGASRANLLSGDAPFSLLTMSTVLRIDRPGRIGEDYYTYFANPYNLLRTVLLVMAEVTRELWQASRQKGRNISPRVHRGFVYAWLRAWTTIIQRDLQTEAIIGDMLIGRPVAYSTFLGYDEVAHHSGIRRKETLSVLKKIDQQFGRIESAIKLAPRPYRLVVLADHGQSQGATFKQRYGLTLEELINQLSSTTTTNLGGNGDEALGNWSASISEARRSSGFMSKLVRLVTKVPKDPNETQQDSDSEIVVMASGCLGLIYLKAIEKRASMEEIEATYPGLLTDLAKHPGVGFLLVDSKNDGPIVIGPNGKKYLNTSRVVGQDPLKNFGTNAANHIKRSSSFKHCADIMVNSRYWAEKDEVAAFEELVGSHGGLGGSQNYPFMLYPKSLPEPKKELVGAEAIYDQFKKWLNET